MPYYEITGVGFDASSDKADHRVIWVDAPDLPSLHDVIAGIPIFGLGEIEDDPGIEKALDYTLPRDASALQAQLRSYASLESQLVEKP